MRDRGRVYMCVIRNMIFAGDQNEYLQITAHKSFYKPIIWCLACNQIRTVRWRGVHVGAVTDVLECVRQRAFHYQPLL